MRILFFLFYFPVFLLAQVDVDSVAAQWTEQLEAETDLVEILQQLSAHPINLNTANAKEMQEVPFITSGQIQHILVWRKQNGPFRSLIQVRKILGTDTYRMLRPFITIKAPVKKGFLKQTTYYPLDLPAAAQNYAGGLWYHKTRFYYPLSQQLRIALLAHKDVGETNLLDFYSGYLSWQQGQWRLIAGRFRIEFGQGLVFANPFSAQKSALVLSSLQENSSFGRPTLSSSENTNFNGLYLGLPVLLGLDMQVFYSQVSRDGRLDEENDLQSLNYDGYHRTSSEIATRTKAQEINAGVTVSHPLNSNTQLYALAGLTRYEPGFSPPQDDSGRDYFKLRGNQLQHYSLALNWRISSVSGSGEAAVSQPGGKGWIQNIRVNTKCARVGFCFWRLDNNFQSPHGAVLGDISPFPRAQKGMYGALELDLRQDLEFKIYRFLRQETWRGYFYDLPQPASEWFTQLTYKRPQRTFYLRLQQQTLPATFHNGSANPQRNYYRGQIQYGWKPDQNWRLRVRLTHNRFVNQDDHGTAIFQELRYQPTKNLGLFGRMTFFKTQGSGILLYEYENDLPGSFANYSMSGEGYKWYLMLSFQPMQFMRLWIKWRYYRRYQNNTNDALLRRELRLQAELFF